MNDPLKILVIRLSSLGDILHTLPAFFDLRNSFPNAKIDWLVGHSSSFLLSAVRGIDAIHIFNKAAVLPVPFKRSSGSSIWNLIRRLREEEYDYSIDFQGLLKTAFLGFMSGAATRVGFPKDLVREPPAHWFYHRTPVHPQKPLHVLTLNRMLAACIGSHPVSGPFEPVVSTGDLDWVDTLIAKEGLTDFAVINPGGGWPSKIWKPKFYGKLAERIQTELNLPVVVTTGPGEDPLYETLAAHCGGKPPVHLQISFLRLIPLLKKARLLIGGDTGPFHLACALGTAVVGIFGPTSPVRNGPWNDEDEFVIHAMSCSDCYKRNCPKDNACMDIPVNEVFAAVTQRLGIADMMSGSMNRTTIRDNPAGDSPSDKE
jgi:heptosyltransferase-1